MVFSSIAFLFAFLPIVAVLYYIIPNRVWRNAVLLVASLFFYAWGEPKFIIVMLFSVFCAYVGGLLIDRFKERPAAKKAVMIAVTVILVGFLFVYKYLNLFADTVGLSIKEIALPIGISFYTFQTLSYVFDLYWGKVGLQKNFFYLLLYVSFFPQLIAGPIVRYETVELEIRERRENRAEFTQGLERFIFGLAKKVLLANNLAKVADGIFAAGAEEAGTLLCWVAILAYTLQIYFDFSGYSDMAIGIGRMFGFHFLENFNYPYAATSVTDFWRRWHISLSTWFRDYIYIPLGGNRVSKGRHILNLMIVWALTGFWHGAEWNFLLWGLYYGILLILEKYLLARVLKKLPRAVGWLYTILLVMIGWVLFYHSDLSALGAVLKAMFVFAPGAGLEVLTADAAMIPALLALPVGAVCAFPLFRRFTEGKGLGVTLTREIVCLGLLALCVVFLLSSSYNPFIYFRF